jgi:exodeoxyribonuclease-3
VLRALTYNLLAGEEDDAERLAQASVLLQAARPDVLGLNECGLLAERDGARLRKLEKALGMRAWLAEAASGFHVALLVRGDFEQMAELHEGFAHTALVAVARVGSLRLRAIATHLDPFSASRRLLEVEQLVQHVRDACPTLLLGDLNAISPRDVATQQPEQWLERYRQRHVDARGAIDTRAIERLQQSGLVDVHAALHTSTAATRPTAKYARSDRPSQRLDYIFASGELARAASQCAVYDHPLAQTTSDHVPVYADFELDAG